MERYYTERVYLPTETLSSMYAPDGTMIAKVMELPWRGNAISPDSSIASCVPEGVYVVRKNPPKPTRDYGYFRFDHVPGRSVNADGKSSILMHRITYVKDLLGCLGIGGRFTDLNNDGVPDIVDSSKKLEWLYQNLPDVFELEIKKKPI